MSSQKSSTRVGHKHRLTTMSEQEEVGGEREVFVSMLSRTLEALCSMQGAPHDDTILHHLLDAIKRLVVSEDDAQRSGLVSFLESVRERAHQLSSAVLVLALGVATHLASLATRGVTGDLLRQRVTSLYKEVQSCGAVDRCTSVGAAYLSGVTDLLDCPHGLQWLEDHSVHFQTALSTLETAESMFLLKAAETLVTAVLIRTLEDDHRDLKHGPPSSALASEGMQLLTTELTNMKENRSSLLDQMIASSHVSPFHQCVTSIVCSLTGCKVFCQWKAEDEGLVSTLAQLALQHPSHKVQSSALHSVVNLVAFMSESTREEFLLKEILSPLLTTMSEGSVERAVSVASAFVNARPDTDTDSSNSSLQSLERMVQLPHQVLFGQQQLSQEPAMSALVSTVTSALADRHRMTRLTPIILQSVRQTGHSAGLVRLVTSAGLTREDEDWPTAVASWPLGVGVVVVGNTKLLNPLLDLLQHQACPELTVEQCSEVLMTLMRIMRRPLVESRLYSQCGGALVALLGGQYRDCGPGQSGLKDTLTHWAGLMEYRLTALQWEIRDTTLEILAKVLAIITDPWFLGVVEEHHLLRLAWGCSRYGESYPRASAISLATSLSTSPLWTAFLQDAGLTQASLVEEMVGVLSSDTEAFPRRAAVLLLTTLTVQGSAGLTPSPHADGSVLRAKVCAAMAAAISDFDWDVKLKVLEFWEKMAAPFLTCEENAEKERACTTVKQENKSSKLHRKRAGPQVNTDVSDQNHVLEALLKDGFGKTVLLGAEDYDSAVKQKALQMLQSVQRQIEGEEKESPAKAQKLHRETDTDTVGADCMNSLEEDRAKNELSASMSKAQFLQAVRKLDPGAVLEQQRSGHEYHRKPESLLEDVMAAVQQSSTPHHHNVTFMSEDEFEDGDDMFVDCY